MKTLISVLSLFLVLGLHAQKPITSVPFELFGDHIIIPVSVDNSRPLDFIFDTGSGYTVLDSDITEELNLSGKEIKMNSTRNSMELLKHNEIEINGFPMEKNVKVYATNLEHLEISLGRDIDGIVGYDLMHHHTIRINYAEKTMDIYDHGRGPKKGDEIIFDLNISIPTINGSVVLNNNESHDGTFFIMTGAGTSLDFNSPYAKEYDVLHKTGKHYSYLVKGIGDEETLHYEGHVVSFSFGKQKLENIPIGISDAKKGIQADPDVAGIIGNKILSMYNITIDVPKRRLYLEKNENFGKTMAVNCSGIDLQFSHGDSHLLIHRVFEDSPASEAGIMVDDQLIAINDTPVSSLALPDIKKMLREIGETVSLKIKQGDEIKTVDLTLRSLID
ncbi:MAG: aspartyl protease family protein [Cyclobacteriaceae bacterium]